eukprot:TRINITY_DN45093_c0_g1_i1.p1 TRINITY_DN45093_c0_g1~~TRINITY_DN45093_c0_g1_i1.p1  ORF type:complete len:614 (-),score=105.87 TRINITY_DN45093_c0_g1_i1:47-1822(-)
MSALAHSLAERLPQPLLGDGVSKRAADIALTQEESEQSPRPCGKRLRRCPFFLSQLLAQFHDDAAKRTADLVLSKERISDIAKIEEFADDALACAVAHGIVMYSEPSSKSHAAVVPITLLPTPFPADLYEEAWSMTPYFLSMMDSVALDIPWMRESLKVAGKMDEITGRLLRICDSVYGPGGRNYAEDIRLHITRNDFMLDTKIAGAGVALRQIELNMIAASFSTHCQDLTEVHRYILTKYLPRFDPELAHVRLRNLLEHALPESTSAQGIARSLAEAHAAYMRKWCPEGGQQVVLFVSSDDEKNELDHRKLEIALFKNYGIVSIRRSIKKLAEQLETLLETEEDDEASCGPRKALVVDGHEVTVAYFREGYWPDQFEPVEPCWAAREAIEASEAVKCPSAPAQLSGMKKVQQLLCSPSVFERFVADPAGEFLRRTFTRQGDPSEVSAEAKAIVTAAMENPAAWVMKPQVEGSGNLLFDDDIPAALKGKSQEELAEFILMERVFPPATPSVVFRAEAGKRAEVVVRSSVAEFGVFGVFLADGDKVLLNEAVGHLLRSKAQDTSQGGVFVGNAVVDVPFLLPPERFWATAAA